MKVKQSITCDGIMLDKGNSAVLLIRRGHSPFQDQWALPGGYVDENERVEQTLIREMKEETSLDVIPKFILGVYSDPQRDPRGHIISVVFICEWQGNLQAGDDARNIRFFPLSDITELNLAFDHNKIITDLIKWLQDPKTTYWSER